MSNASKALRAAACIAFRYCDQLPESEREQVLVALIEVLPDREAELAQTVLFHLQHQRKHQLELKAIIEGLK